MELVATVSLVVAARVLLYLSTSWKAVEMGGSDVNLKKKKFTDMERIY